MKQSISKHRQYVGWPSSARALTPSSTPNRKAHSALFVENAWAFLIGQPGLRPTYLGPMSIGHRTKGFYVARMKLSDLKYPEWMKTVYAYCDKHWDADICSNCGGLGTVPIRCCSGMDCGCQGAPVDFDFLCSDCGRPGPEEIDCDPQPFF